MAEILAVCGLDCSQCEAYLATQANNLAELERVALKWQQEYNAQGVTAAGVVCDGCLAVTGRLSVHCYECAPRLCAVERGYANCAFCPEYGCAKITQFLSVVPYIKDKLDRLHAKAFGI